MFDKNKKKKKPFQDLFEISLPMGNLYNEADPLGSYTGIPADPSPDDLEPEQDADDI